MSREKERYDVKITTGVLSNQTKAQNISKRTVLHMIEDAIEEHGTIAAFVSQVVGEQSNKVSVTPPEGASWVVEKDDERTENTEDSQEAE